MICIALRKTSAAGLIGPFEAALMDRHTLHDPAQPFMIQCTVHSFDPCIACAVYVTDAEGTERALIKVH
ncbi:MAG: nickel-dependent hydrogenase large subunit [Yoonia sp.]